jgi:hypothetical protein
VAEAADLLAKVAAELAYDIHHTAFANCVEAPEQFEDVPRSTAQGNIVSSTLKLVRAATLRRLFASLFLACLHPILVHAHRLLSAVLALFSPIILRCISGDVIRSSFPVMYSRSSSCRDIGRSEVVLIYLYSSY